MKNIILFLVILLFAGQLSAQTNNPNYDPVLAKSLNADDLGMKMYVLVILKTGDAKITDKATRDSLFKGHFANINRLVALKKMVVAGPLEKNENEYRGIFILDVPTVEEARLLLQNDPTVKENIFKTEYYQWYGSAALPQYLNAADKIWKKKP